MDARVTKSQTAPASLRDRGPGAYTRRDPQRGTRTHLQGVERRAHRSHCQAREHLEQAHDLLLFSATKEGFYIAVLEETYTAIRTAESRLNLTGRNPTDGMRELVEFTWHYFIDHPEFFDSLLATREFRSRPLSEEFAPDSRAALAADRNDDAVARRGAREGIFRAGIDPVQLYITIASLRFFYLSDRHTLSTDLSGATLNPAKRWTRVGVTS